VLFPSMLFSMATARVSGRSGSAVNRGSDGVQLVLGRIADESQRGDDNDRDQSQNQSVFGQSLAALVLDEVFQHGVTPFFEDVLS